MNNQFFITSKIIKEGSLTNALVVGGGVIPAAAYASEAIPSMLAAKRRQVTKKNVFQPVPNEVAANRKAINRRKK